MPRKCKAQKLAFCNTSFINLMHLNIISRLFFFFCPIRVYGALLDIFLIQRKVNMETHRGNNPPYYHLLWSTPELCFPLTASVMLTNEMNHFIG